MDMDGGRTRLGCLYRGRCDLRRRDWHVRISRDCIGAPRHRARENDLSHGIGRQPPRAFALSQRLVIWNTIMVMIITGRAEFSKRMCDSTQRNPEPASG